MVRLTELTIKEASDHIARHSVSVSELVEATLLRIQETEPYLHAYAAIMAENARRTAVRLDVELQQQHWRGPLHGIPIAVKDLVYTKDAPTEGGSAVLAGFVPAYDATVVTKLREAGAVIVGKTVTHEFAYGRNVPPTRNAWKQDCDPGSSSAGSGVAVAARSAFGAIGTDSAGSIRNPASSNGVVGLKPTFARVSRHGIIPMSDSLDAVGPLARTVEDCALVLTGIAGFDPSDSTTIDEPVPNYADGISLGVQGIRLGIDRDYFLHEDVIAEVRQAVEDAVDEFEHLGATIVEVRIPELKLTVPAGQALLLVDTSTWHRRLLRERGNRYTPATRIMLELGELIPGTHYVTAQRVRSVIRESMKAVFHRQDLSALIAPTMPTAATRVDELFDDRPRNEDTRAMSGGLHQLFAANVVGQPALSIPCGFSPEGLPFGLQLIGRPFDEQTLLRVAYAYEQATDWHRRTPYVGPALRSN